MNNIQTIHCHPLLHIAGLHVTSRWHVNGREQKHFSPLGTKRYFLMNSPRKFFALTPNMAALSRGCKPRILAIQKRIGMTLNVRFLEFNTIVSHDM